MENNKKGHNTLVVFHYGGHGANHLGVIQAVLNDKEPKNRSIQSKEEFVTLAKYLVFT